MASTLVLDNLMQDFTELPSQAEEYMLPESINREHFSLFLRMMKAKTPGEIEDIPLDIVLEMFEHVYEYSSCIREHCMLRGNSMLNKLKGVPSGTKKRPL